MKSQITRQSDLYDLEGNKIDGFLICEGKGIDGESYLLDVINQKVLSSHNSHFINFKREILNNEKLEKIVLIYLKKVGLIDIDNQLPLLRIIAEGRLVKNGRTKQRILPLYENMDASLVFYSRQKRDATFGHALREFLKDVISEQIEEEFNPPHYIYTDDFI